MDSASLASQRDIVDGLRFRLELLSEDIKLEPAIVEESRYTIGGPIRPPLSEKFAQLRADAARLASAVTDPQVAERLRTDVLDPLDDLAKTQFAETQRSDASQVAILSSQEQSDAVKKLRFDVELLKEDVKQVHSWLEERPDAPLLRAFIREKFGRLRADSTRLAPSITDPHWAREMREGVLEPLDELAKASYVAER